MKRIGQYLSHAPRSECYALQDEHDTITDGFSDADAVMSQDATLHDRRRTAHWETHAWNMLIIVHGFVIEQRRS